MEEHASSSAARAVPRIRQRRGDAKNPLRRTISANSLSGSGSCEGETTTSDSMKERLRRDSQSLSDSSEKLLILDKHGSAVENMSNTSNTSNHSSDSPVVVAGSLPAAASVSSSSAANDSLSSLASNSFLRGQSTSSAAFASAPFASDLRKLSTNVSPPSTPHQAPAPVTPNSVGGGVSRNDPRGSLSSGRARRSLMRQSAHFESSASSDVIVAVPSEGQSRRSREEQASPGRAGLTLSSDDALLLGKKSPLLGSGTGLLEFLGFRRKSSSSGIATDVGLRVAPARMIVGNYLVARQREALSQRSIRQEGKMLVVMRLNMNKVDFSVNLTAVTIVEQREEQFMGSRMMCVCLTVSSRELVLISAGSDEETSALHELLTAWVRFYVGKVIDSPRGSPRRGQLRGYLLRTNGKSVERLWASQISNDTLSLFQSRGRESVASLDMSALSKCAFDPLKLEINLFLEDRKFSFQCENDDAFVYWKAGVLKYAPEQKTAPVTQTIELGPKDPRLQF